MATDLGDKFALNIKFRWHIAKIKSLGIIAHTPTNSGGICAKSTYCKSDLLTFRGPFY